MIYHHRFPLWLVASLPSSSIQSLKAKETTALKPIKRRSIVSWRAVMTSFSTSARFHGALYCFDLLFFPFCLLKYTQWPALKEHTAPPYTLSLKSNGCIIFIAALTSSKLLITSKHSIGPVAGYPISHAQAGEAWLRKYLKNKGRTEEQLASCLWENNWTAISEVN